MEIHVKKIHSEKIRFGLCASEFSDLGSIDIHLQTCETYKCIECRTVFKQLYDVKEHVRNIHEGENMSFIHTKSDINISDYFDNKMYNIKEEITKIKITLVKRDSECGKWNCFNKSYLLFKLQLGVSIARLVGLSTGVFVFISEIWFQSIPRSHNRSYKLEKRFHDFKQKAESSKLKAVI